MVLTIKEKCKEGHKMDEKKNTTQDGKKLDRRRFNHGTIGNKGGGRIKGSGYADPDGSKRVNFSLSATSEEYEVVKRFSKLLKKDSELADMVLSKLSVPPAKRLYGGNREQRTIKGTPIERDKIRQALQSIKWYYEPSKEIIDKAIALAGLE